MRAGLGDDRDSRSCSVAAALPHRTVTRFQREIKRHLGQSDRVVADWVGCPPKTSRTNSMMIRGPWAKSISEQRLVTGSQRRLGNTALPVEQICAEYPRFCEPMNLTQLFKRMAKTPRPVSRRTRVQKAAARS